MSGDDDPADQTQSFQTDDGCEGAVFLGSHYRTSENEAERTIARYADYRHQTLMIGPGAMYVVRPADKAATCVVACSPHDGGEWMVLSVPDRLDWRGRFDSFVRNSSLDLSLAGAHAVSTAEYSSVLRLGLSGPTIPLPKDWYEDLESYGCPPGNHSSFVHGHEAGWVEIYGAQDQGSAVKNLRRDGSTVHKVSSRYATFTGGYHGWGFIISTAGVTVLFSVHDGSAKLMAETHELARYVMSKLEY